MSRCHLAALALLGWYLMMPPWKPKLDVNAPLSRWVAFRYPTPMAGKRFAVLSVSNDKFRDPMECQESLATLRKEVKRRAAQNIRNADARFLPSDKDLAVMVAHAICIEDSDRRLKGNIRYTGK